MEIEGNRIEIQEGEEIPTETKEAIGADSSIRRGIIGSKGMSSVAAISVVGVVEAIEVIAEATIEINESIRARREKAIAKKESSKRSIREVKTDLRGTSRVRWGKISHSRRRASSMKLIKWLLRQGLPPQPLTSRKRLNKPMSTRRKMRRCS